MMTKDQVHEAIDRLTDDQLNQVRAVLEQLSAGDPRGRWRNIPGIRLPAVWPPDYGDFRPVEVPGEPVSEQLIRERR
jgi:hypothetical protein